ncbi:MAG: hypothetical protein K6E20_04910 [Acholeplasmatales bacterium]|nr:hypothetical protein [Acholeplasmatales bacterium]
MKKRFLIPLLAFGLLLTACDDSHSVKKDVEDIKIVKRDYVVGNTEGQKKYLLDTVLKDIIIVDKADYEANYNVLGNYVIKVNMYGELQEINVEVNDIVIPEIQMSVIAFESHVSSPLTDADILKYVTATDDNTESDKIVLKVVDGNTIDGFNANKENKEKIGTSYSLTVQAYDEAGNGASKPITIKIVE